MTRRSLLAAGMILVTLNIAAAQQAPSSELGVLVENGRYLPNQQACEKLRSDEGLENPDLLIVKDGVITGWESQCEVLRATPDGQQAEVDLQCGGEGDTWSLTTRFSRSDERVNFGDLGNNQDYVLCGAAAGQKESDPSTAMVESGAGEAPPAGATDLWSDPLINDWLIGRLSTSYFYAGSATGQAQLPGTSGCFGYLVATDQMSMDVEDILARRSISELIAQCDDVIADPNKYRLIVESITYAEMVLQRALLKKMIDDETGLQDLDVLSAFVEQNGSRTGLSRNPVFELQTWKFSTAHQDYVTGTGSKGNDDEQMDASVACSIADHYLAADQPDLAKAALFSYMAKNKQFPRGTIAYPRSFVLVAAPESADPDLVQSYDDSRNTELNAQYLAQFQDNMVMMRDREGCNLPFVLAKIERARGDISNMKMLLDLATLVEKSLNDYFITSGYRLTSFQGVNDGYSAPEFFFNDARLSKARSAMENQPATLALLMAARDSSPAEARSDAGFVTLTEYATSGKLDLQPALKGSWTMDAFNPGICGTEGIELQNDKIRVGTRWCEITDVRFEPILDKAVLPALSKCGTGEKPEDSNISCDDPIANYVRTEAYLINYLCDPETASAETGLISLWVDRVTRDATATSFPRFFNDSKATALLNTCE